MDRLRTLLLARAQMVVLDADRVADAATRPSRDVDVERFEDDLVQRGFVLSLDLAMAIRRLPFAAIQELRTWMSETLGVAHPRLAAPVDGALSPYLGHVLAWLAASPEQPCPWCSEVRRVGALDPCGHLVCHGCWEGGTYAGCPICHRRVTPGAPFVRVDPAPNQAGTLRVLHLAYDLHGTAKQRFERLVGRATRLAPDERAEVETVIDAIGPRAALWLPARIPVRETMAIAVARLWIVAPDRMAMMKATQGHLRAATDVLRVALVLLGGDAGLAGPSHLVSVGRSVRRALVAAVDRLPAATLAEDLLRHRRLWQRVGERLHPFELARQYPNAALGFAAVRGTEVARASFAAAVPASQLEAGRVRVARWAAPIEAALRAGDAAAAARVLAERPPELLARVDQLLRLAPPAQRGAVLEHVARAIEHGAPAVLLGLAAHLATRVRGAHPLDADTVERVLAMLRGELLARAERRRPFARGVIDRALAEYLAPSAAPRRDRRGRPTLFELAAIHAAARANIVYVREPATELAISIYRRREGEPTLARLARIHAAEPDAQHTRIPLAQAPTFVALVRDDLELPTGSTGFVLAPSPRFAADAAPLLDELTGGSARKPA